MKRSSRTASTTARLEEPTSETTQSPPALASAALTAAGSVPTGAATNAASAPASADAASGAARSSAPTASAVASTPSAGSQPATSAPSRARAARPIEPPIRPTPTIAIFTPAMIADRRRRSSRGRVREHLPGDRRRALDLLRVRREAVRPQLLRAVADGLVRLRVDLDDDPVRAGRRGRERERLDQRAPPGGVAGVDDHRQVRELLQHRDRREVEREAVSGLEGADPALAQQHVGVALLEHVLGRHQQLLERRRQPALEQDRLARAADLGQQRVVLHVARADLDHVGHLDHGLEIARVQQLGHDRQPGLGLRLGQQPQALLPETLERVGRRPRLVGAAAEKARAAGGDHVRGRQRLVARLDGAGAGDEREGLAAEAAAVDVHDGPLAWLELGRREIERLKDRHDLLDALVALEPEAGDVLAVADGADHGDFLTARRVSPGTAALDAVDDGEDVFLGCRRLHDDHHLRTPERAWLERYDVWELRRSALGP